MKTHMLTRVAAIVTTLLLVTGLMGPANASAQTIAAPQWGVPGSTFVFLGSGFKGSSGDHEGAAGEKLVFWINTPDGRMIDTRQLDDEDDVGRTEVPLTGGARHDGTFVFTWKSPLDSVIGDYTMVAHGMSSKHEEIFPFTIKPQSAMTVVQRTVIPEVGKAGTGFYFTAKGFQGGPSKDDAGERIAYWINLPDGRVIATEDEKDDDELTPSPLIDRARHDGTVRLTWTAPADAPAGSYTLVMHGLETQLEVILPFTVQ